MNCISVVFLSVFGEQLTVGATNWVVSLGVPTGLFWPTTQIGVTQSQVLESSFGDKKCPYGTLSPPLFHLDYLHICIYFRKLVLY